MSQQPNSEAAAAALIPDLPNPETGRFAGRRGLWSGLVLIAACVAFASYTRLAQLAAWERESAQYVASGVPMMTTFDAYYSLRLARLYADGKFVPHGPVPARHYARPEQADPSMLYDQREPQALPLLSRLLAVAASFTGQRIDTVGLLVSPLLSSLFMVPLFLCCRRLGAPAAGLMGALVATFCIDYYRRTSVGWVDTDCLNLFFPWTASLLVLSMHDGQRREKQLLFSAALGGVLYAFNQWYGKPGLSLAYVLSLVVYLRLAHVAWSRTILCALTVIVFADVLQFRYALLNLGDFAARYLWPSATLAEVASPGIRFPQVWSTIGEARPLRSVETLQRTVGSAALAVVGLAGFAFLAMRRWRSIVALAPLVALGMLALVSSQRFVFYLAPLVGIGWGVVISLATASFVQFVKRRARSRADDPANGERFQSLPRARPRFAIDGVRVDLAYAAVLVVFAAFFWPLSASRGYVPPPAIPAPIFRDLQLMAKEFPADARVWTWWDAGFAIVDTTGFGVYHDGSAQYTPQTNLIATSFASDDPRLMRALIGFVDREGNRGIRRLETSARSFDQLLTVVRGGDLSNGDVPIYVLFTPDMLAKFPAIRTLGMPDASPVGNGPGIQLLPCRQIVDDTVQCAGITLDLKTGTLRPASPGDLTAPTGLRRALIVEGGQVLREREYRSEGGLTVEIVVQGTVVEAVYLLDETGFASNLNQMFMLGRFDKALFEEAFNDFPYARAFRVLTPPG